LSTSNVESPAATKPAAGSVSARAGDCFAATFSSLRGRNYRVFWTSQLAAQTAMWTQRTAMSWLVLELTNSPLALGVVTMLNFAPALIFTLVGGVMADRLPKQRVMLVTQAGLAVQGVLLALLVSSGHIELWHIYVLAVFQGLLSALDTPTRSAFAMELVGPDHLANALTLNSASFNLSRIVGPAVAGTLIASVGNDVSFWLTAVGYLLSVGGITRLRPSEYHGVSVRPPGSAARQLVQGLAYAVATPRVFAILLGAWAMGTFGFNFVTFVPLLARFAFDAGPEAFGVLSSSVGIGSLATALAVAGRRGTSMRLMIGSGLTYSALLAVVGLCPWYPVEMVLLGALGGAGLVFGTSAQTLLQEAAPGPLRGRIVSLYSMFTMGMSLLGSVTVGAFAETYSIRVALVIMATVCGAGVLASLMYARTRIPPASAV
jgi:MFS family permease